MYEPPQQSLPGSVPTALMPTAAVRGVGDGVVVVHGGGLTHFAGDTTDLLTFFEHLQSGLAGPVAKDTLEFQVLMALRERGLLTTSPLSDPDGRVPDNQFQYLAAYGVDLAGMQRALAASAVAVLGCGGVGSLVAEHLAAAGVGQLTLIDHDVVVADNFNRQYVFRTADVGRPKTEALAHHLRDRYPEVTLTSSQQFVAANGDLVAVGDVSLLVCAADTPPGLYDVIDDWHARTGTPCIRASVGVERGTWGPMVLDRLSTWASFDETLRQRLNLHGRELSIGPRIPLSVSSGPINSLIAAALARECVEFLATGDCDAVNAQLYFDRRRIPRIDYATPGAADVPSGATGAHS